jgi:hypothetical protein
VKIPGIPHFSSKTTSSSFGGVKKFPSPKFGAPKPGVTDERNIIGFGEHSKFFTPKQPVKVKSGILELGGTKVKPTAGNLSAPFPPKLKGLP